jgi:ABC-type sugar transport system ATPase subunit
MTTQEPAVVPEQSTQLCEASRPLLQLDGISVAYRGHEVVHDVSLTVDPGEVVALIGPSGAGKSSLLRSINFLEPPSRGHITLDGAVIPQRRGPPAGSLL